MNDKPGETNKALLSNQVMGAMAEGQNDQKNTDINCELRPEESNDPIDSFSSNKDLEEEATETSKFKPSNRVMKTMFKSFNNPTNSDFKFKIKRQECDDPESNCP